MIARIRHAASFSNVTACLALFIALGGTGYAALKLPRNSVTSREVKDRSLRLRDFSRSDQSRLGGDPGKQGPQGAAGPQGTPGLAGPVGLSRVHADVLGDSVNLPDGGDVEVRPPRRPARALPPHRGRYCASFCLRRANGRVPF